MLEGGILKYSCCILGECGSFACLSLKSWSGSSHQVGRVPEPFKFCRLMTFLADFLGLTDDEVLKLDAIKRIKGLYNICERATAEVQAILQTVSPMEVIPSKFLELASCIEALPPVIEWRQLSAYRRGVTQGLALGKAHFPWDWKHEDLSSG